MITRFARVLLIIAAAAMMVIPALAQESDDIVTFRDAPPDPDAVALEPVITGLRNPLQVTHADDDSGRLFIVQQAGLIYVYQDGELLETPFIDLSDVASQDITRGYSERGLLGLAFHPDFAQNGLFYVNYTDATSSHATRVVEFSVSADDPSAADRDSARTLMTIGQPYANHNGGHMAFGPDGYLYISVGDGGSSNDPLAAGQDPSTLLGTILRIDVDDHTDARDYGIPSDNPAMRDPMFAPEVWSWGLRNVWRFSFDRATGDLYLADVGQNAIEEVNFQPADSPGSENYGWVAYEGSTRYRGPDPATEVVMPVAEYGHNQGCSITGGYVYRGEAIPDMQGAYYYADWCSGNMWSLYRDADGEWQAPLFKQTGISISSFGEDEAGELYVVDYAQGRVLRFEPVE